MKILIINPNSSQEMTAAIQSVAADYAGDAFEVETLSTPGAPEYIDYYTDQALAAPGMMQIVRDNEKDFDAFVVACHCDPNLDLLKQITDRPVVGIGEASMKIASMLGHSFSGGGDRPGLRGVCRYGGEAVRQAGGPCVRRYCLRPDGGGGPCEGRVFHQQNPPV